MNILPQMDEGIKLQSATHFWRLHKSFGDGSMMDHGHFVYFPKEETQLFWKDGEREFPVSRSE